MGTYESHTTVCERMRSRLTTQVGRRLVQKVQKQVEPLEMEARLWKVMESQGMNLTVTLHHPCATWSVHTPMEDI